MFSFFLSSNSAHFIKHFKSHPLSSHTRPNSWPWIGDLKPPIYYLHWSSALMGLLPLMCYFLSWQVSTPSSLIIAKLSFIYLFTYLVTWFMLEDKRSLTMHSPWVEVYFLIRENRDFITQANTANPTRLKLSHNGLFNASIPFLEGFEMNKSSLWSQSHYSWAAKGGRGSGSSYQLPETAFAKIPNQKLSFRLLSEFC